MKKLLALLLCLCFALGGCAQNDVTQHDEEGGGVMPVSDQTQREALSIEKLALATAELPELPEEPDEAAFYEELDALDYDKLGAEAYSKAYDELWGAYSTRQDAYYAAMEALRGEGVSPTLKGALTSYTLRTAERLTAEETEKNVVYSPANLYLALSMLAETTDGDSRAQILSLLGLDSVEQARTAANAIWRNLYRDGAQDKVLLANAVWLNDKLEIKQDTVDTLAKDYYASAFRAPMGSAATDDAIRQWVNDNTNHLLEEAANGLKTDDDTLMMLLSALYFKGTWADQFAAFETREDTFTAADGAAQTIDFMHSVKNGTYYRIGNYTAAALPFRDGMSMWFLLPDEGTRLNDVWTLTWNLPMIATTTSEGCYEMPDIASLAQEGTGEIHWSVPKFDVQSDLDLIPALKTLGVENVFDDRADFTPLTDTPAVVSAVEHAARVKVDEEGCEAAAFTAITAEATSALVEPLPVVEMNLNRPFGFLITGVTGLPLFLGAVNTTAAS